MLVEIAMPKKGGEPQVKGPEMNDRDFVNDLLAYEKQLSVNYSIGLNEMQNPKLHQEIQNILMQSHQNQLTLFNLMFDMGWYKMKAADVQEIGKLQQQFTNYKTQFPAF